jgi:hypothetical protein
MPTIFSNCWPIEILSTYLGVQITYNYFDIPPRALLIDLMDGMILTGNTKNLDKNLSQLFL